MNARTPNVCAVRLTNRRREVLRAMSFHPFLQVARQMLAHAASTAVNEPPILIIAVILIIAAVPLFIIGLP
jgi:hypothetical protein